MVWPVERMVVCLFLSDLGRLQSKSTLRNLQINLNKYSQKVVDSKKIICLSV